MEVPDFKYTVDGRIWVNVNNQSYIGKGKIILLEKIKELGSLRKAAIELKMSYRQAWYSINQINTFSKTPVVILKRGGKDGGIAIITEQGEDIIKTFNQLQKDFFEYLNNKNNQILF